MSTIGEHRLECKRSVNGITELTLNGSTVEVNSSLIKEIDDIFRQDISDHQSHYHILIENGRVTSKGCVSLFDAQINLESSSLNKIFKKCSEIEESIKANHNYQAAVSTKPIILEKVKTNTIEALDKKIADPKITKLLLIGMVFGFLATVIGIGSLLTQFKVVTPNMGIIGISKNLSMGLIGAGTTLTVAPLLVTAAASKKADETFKTKCDQYLEGINSIRNNWSLDSNLNDITGCLLFFIMALSLSNIGFFHKAWVTTMEGCLSYPTGILFISSGLMQLNESIKSLINANKIDDSSEKWKQRLNILTSALVALVGVFVTIGMINSPITIGLSALFGLSAVIVAGQWGLRKSIEKWAKIKEISENDSNAIKAYLNSTLNLSESEIKEISDKISKMSSDEVSKWISDNFKNWNEEQQDNWKRLKNVTEANLEKIKQLIINDSIKKAIELKQEDFRAMVSEDTFKEALDAVNCKKTDEDLRKIFAKIKKEVKVKIIAEFVKFTFVYLPFFLVPLLGGFINKAIYDLLMGTVSLLSLGINITPRFRNVAPAIDKEPLDINKDLYNPILEKPKNQTFSWGLFSTLTPAAASS